MLFPEGISELGSERVGNKIGCCFQKKSGHFMQAKASKINTVQVWKRLFNLFKKPVDFE